MKRRPIRSVTVAAMLVAVVSLAGCAASRVNHLETAAPRAQMFDEMGAYKRAITTDSPEAQAYFDQGIAWLHAFNHDEGIRSFAKAAELDPEAAMPWWGIALAEGPNYNDSKMTKDRSTRAWAALVEARARIDNTSPVERALIDALAARYTKRHTEDRRSLNQAYAEAMEEVWADYPDDPDVGALYAEAVMTLRPWKLYTPEGEPEADTPEIVAALERVLEMAPGHPGANHLYIHAIEPSTNPGLAEAAADRLCEQMPGAGHLNHMPSHIYVQIGEWDKSVTQNALAMEADDRYRELSPDQGIQHMYMVHNAHMLAYSAMMVGREEEAMHAARDMWADMPDGVLEQVSPFVDMWMTSVYDVQKRFGRWDDLLAEPGPPEYLPITTAVWHAHRAVAHAAKQDFEAARAEQKAFLAAKEAIPEDSVFGGDPSRKILEVSEHFIEGEIALQQEDWDAAIAALEKAVEVEDTLSYGEPPQWLQPTRHTLGAVYLSIEKPAEAERVYRDDLEKWPGNGWSLYGLGRALRAQGKDSEAEEVETEYAVAWGKADEPTTTSCKCIAGI